MKTPIGTRPKKQHCLPHFIPDLLHGVTLQSVTHFLINSTKSLLTHPEICASIVFGEKLD